MKNAPRIIAIGIFSALSNPCALAASPADVSKYGTHEGPRFAHRITVEDCVLIETQWENQSGGSRVLWEETHIPLRGAALFDLMAYVPQDESTPSRSSTMIDATDHPETPSASITVLAQKGTPGVVESLASRRLAQSMIKRKKATPSPRNGGMTHVTFPAKQVLILWRGRDVAPQLMKLEEAISIAIADCNPVS